MDLKKRTKTTTTSTHRAKLNRTDLLELLQDHGVPPDAEVYVSVPTGADWSGMRLEIGSDTLLSITWHDKT